MKRIRLNEQARKFLRELGGIVLGVLIALGIGEVADDLRWKAKASNSMRAMRTELSQAAGVLDERVLAQPCLNRRLEQLDRLVRDARRTRSLPDLPTIGRPPVRPLLTVGWDDALDGGVLSHLNASDRTMLGLNYPLLKAYPGEVNQEAGLWATLHIIQGTPGPVSDEILSQASVTIAQLQWASQLNHVNAEQLRESIVATGIKPNYHLIFDRDGSRADVVKQLSSRQICQPFRPVAGATRDRR